LFYDLPVIITEYRFIADRDWPTLQWHHADKYRRHMSIASDLPPRPPPALLKPTDSRRARGPLFTQTIAKGTCNGHVTKAVGDWSIKRSHGRLNPIMSCHFDSVCLPYTRRTQFVYLLRARQVVNPFDIESRFKEGAITRPLLERVVAGGW